MRRRSLRKPLAGFAALMAGGVSLVVVSPAPAVPQPGNPPNIFSYLRSLDGGSTISPLSLNDASVEATQSHVEAGGGGVVHALYDDADPQPRRLFYRRSTTDGTTFGPSARLDRPQYGGVVEVGDSGEGDLAASGTNVHAVWEDDRLLKANLVLAKEVQVRKDITLADGVTVFRAETDDKGPLFLDDGDDTNNRVLPAGTVFTGGSIDPFAEGNILQDVKNEAPPKPKFEFKGKNRDDFWYSRSTDGGVTFSLPVNVSDSDTIHNRDPDVAEDGTNVVVAYEGSDEVGKTTKGDDVFFAYSSDNGVTFAETNRNVTSLDAAQDEPNIALEAGQVTIAYRGTDGGRKAGFVHAATVGGAFSAPVTLPNTMPAPTLVPESAHAHTTPGIFAQGTTVQILSCENLDFDKAVDGGETFKLLRWTSTDSGTTFPNQPDVLDSGAGRCGKPTLDGSGTALHIVYERDVAGVADAFTLRSADGGLTFEPARNLSNDPYGSADPDISVDPTNAGKVFYNWTNQHDMLFALKYGEDLVGENGQTQKYGNEDVIRSTGNVYEMVLDGSDVGLKSYRIDGLAMLSPTEFLLSFTEPGKIPGLGKVTVDDSDIVKFTATGLGDVTAGTFSMWFDGSDVGLTKSGEDVDAIEVRTANGVQTVYLSTEGSFSATGAAGKDEDIFTCVPTTLGDITACSSMAVVFDGDVRGLGDSGEDIDAFSFDAVDPTLTVNGKGDKQSVDATQAFFSFDDDWAVLTAGGGRSDLGQCVFPQVQAVFPGPAPVAFDLPDCLTNPAVPMRVGFPAAGHGITEDIVAIEFEY